MNQKPFYAMSWEEVLRAGEARQTLVSSGGYLVCSRDRMFNEKDAMYLWRADIDNALFKGFDVPEANVKFTGTVVPKNIVAAGKEEKKSLVLNRKGKPFSWSFSAKADYDTCGGMYACKRFFCTAVDQQSEAMRDGNIKHKALELNIKDQKPLPANLAFALKYCDAFRKIGGKLEAEREITFDRGLKPVSWFAKDAWGRCKIDVLVRKGDTAVIVDWKSGKQKDDVEQVKLNAAFLAKLDPSINRFIGKYVWLKNDCVSGVEISRDEALEVWDRTMITLDEMEECWRTEEFRNRPSGLCGWCPAAPDCPDRR